MNASQDPRDVQRDDDELSQEYHWAEEHVSELSDVELCMLVGAVVGELVNRGNDHETAVEIVHDAAHEGAEGSRVFDMMAD